MIFSPLSSSSDKTISAAQAVLSGEMTGWRRFLPFLGPALIASVAYMDPGNFATNIESGAQFGYRLLWVVFLSNFIAMLFQALSAKLGIITGMSLAQQCREYFPRPLVLFMWVMSEIAAMATDLAELLGASIALTLLFGFPLLLSLILVALFTYALLSLQKAGFRPIEIMIGSFVTFIGLCYLIELIIAPPEWKAFAYHMFVPSLAGPQSIMLATGIVGATIMPHAIYLHSSLTQNRIPASTVEQKRKVLRFSNMEVGFALTLAGLVNIAMVTMSASVFHGSGHREIASIETAYFTLIPLLGNAAASIFLLSLLASGLSSSVVGTMAGQGIMQDFIRFPLPLWIRRLLTMIPTFIVILLGVDVTYALILSQVVLSLVLPIPMISLLIMTRRKEVMGPFANSMFLHLSAVFAALLVLILNFLLLYQFFFSP